MAAVLAALLTGSGWPLAVPLVVGLVALSWKNPLFLLLRPVLRKPSSAYMQEDGAQQRFNQQLSVSLLLLAVLARGLSLFWLGDIFAVSVGLAAFVAMLGYCIGCAVRFRLLMLRHKREMAQASR